MRTLLPVLVLALGLVAAPTVGTAGARVAPQAQARVDGAAKLYAIKLASWKAGTATLDEVAAWSVRWLTAQRELPQKGAKLKAALADHLARMQDVAAIAADRVNAGASPAADADAAAYFVAEAELWVARKK